ncbi:hypothetical protein JXA80_11130 [bacterium]|nr:hypothetical protein [candidate division CSSED10-310 bacterium]
MRMSILQDTCPRTRNGYRAFVLCCLIMIMTVLPVSGQDAQPAPAETMEPDIAPDLPRAPTPIPEEEQKFIYNSHGMRDPFVSLLVRKDLDVSKVGIAAMKISEIKLQGLQIGLGKVAIVQGPDGKAYNMEVGQSLLDGKVVAIMGRKVVFEQVILDPFGRVKDKKEIELYLH